MYIFRINRPNKIPEIISIILVSPSAEKDSLNKIVEIINPVFLII